MKMNLNPLFIASALLLTICVLPQPLTADIVWSDDFADGDEVVDGRVVGLGNNQITITNSVFSDFDSGANDLSVSNSPFFMSYSADQMGANSDGHLRLSFQNEANDPVDYLEQTYTFANSAKNLSFSILDVDLGPNSGPSRIDRRSRICRRRRGIC